MKSAEERVVIYEAALGHILETLEGTEINLANYNEDDVTKLDMASTGAWSLAKNALEVCR